MPCGASGREDMVEALTTLFVSKQYTGMVRLYSFDKEAVKQDAERIKAAAALANVSALVEARGRAEEDSSSSEGGSIACDS